MERLGQGIEKTGIRIDLPEETSQRLIKRTGVVLRRGNYMEGDIAALLFLKSGGTNWVYVPGASKGSMRFGGALEPFVWGHYQLYQSKRKTYLKEIEVTEDFWALRRHPRAVIQAVRWAKMLERHLIPGYPYDDLLALFYWALKALSEGVAPELLDARFLWRWLLSWGIAPDLRSCGSCGKPLGGRAVWREGTFVCTDCAPGQSPVDIDEFAAYALSKSFVPENGASKLLEQARNVQQFFVRNLDDNR